MRFARMDAMTLPCLPSCECEACLLEHARTHQVRMAFLRYLFVYGHISEEIHVEPDARWHFAKWLVQTGRLSDGTPEPADDLPARLWDVWRRPQEWQDGVTK